jgi:peptidoglycan-associated lipoprotein
MYGKLGGMAGVAALAVVAACSSNPKPAATTPAASAAQERAAGDSAMRELARRDSLARLARADSIARAEQERAHADSVRAEAMRESVSPAKDPANTGLSSADAATMGEQVRFDYDRADLRAGDIQLLQRKLPILQAHPELVVRIAGNCDERGSDEYNMALGERRAAAARRWLTAHGIAEDRISVVSYGEERPLDPGHTEEAWAANRRDEFVVTRRIG